MRAVAARVSWCLSPSVRTRSTISLVGAMKYRSPLIHTGAPHSSFQPAIGGKNANTALFANEGYPSLRDTCIKIHTLAPRDRAIYAFRRERSIIAAFAVVRSLPGCRVSSNSLANDSSICVILFRPRSLGFGFYALRHSSVPSMFEPLRAKAVWVHSFFTI